MSREPVAWKWRQRPHESKAWGDWYVNLNTKPIQAEGATFEIQPLYATPQQAQPPVPDGWVMVPREPTPDMNSHGALALYRAMIASSPPAPAVQPLTDEQIDEIWDGSFDASDPKRELSFRQTITRAIEQAHGIAAPGSKP